jgi:hypothetical protein
VNNNIIIGGSEAKKAKLATDTEEKVPGRFDIVTCEFYVVRSTKKFCAEIDLFFCSKYNNMVHVRIEIL